MSAPAALPRESTKTLYTIERDGTMRLHLHPGQWKAWNSHARFIFMLAGTQSGKTSFGPHWLRREMALCGPGDYIAVTSTFPLLKLKMLPEFLRVFRDELKLGIWKASDHAFEIDEYGQIALWGQAQSELTRVIFGSATNSESLESATAKAAWLDEVGQDDFRMESWEAIRRRLSLHRGRILGGTTVYNLGWLKSIVYDRWRAGDERFEVIQFGSTVNPSFPEAEYREAEQDLPEWKFRMFYRGEFTRPAGLIYADYIDEYRENGGHVVRPFAIPPSWPRYGGLDFGGVNLARLLVAHDPDADVYYVYEESLEGDKTTPEHVAAAELAVAGTNMRTWHGGSKSENQSRLDWGAAGLRVHEPEISDVESGIDRVTRLVKQFRLYVFESCLGLRSEFGTYARVLDSMGNPTKEIKDKRMFHRLDALRYVAIGLEAAPAYGAAIEYSDQQMADAYGKPREDW